MDIKSIYTNVYGHGTPYEPSEEDVLATYDTDSGKKMRVVYLGEILADCASVGLSDPCVVVADGKITDEFKDRLVADTLQLVFETNYDGIYPVTGLLTEDGRLIEITISFDCNNWLDADGEFVKKE